MSLAVKEFLPMGVRLWHRGTFCEEIDFFEPMETEIVLGRCSSIRDEVDLGRTEASGVRVSRRQGGGCSVVVSPGMLLLHYLRRGRSPRYPVDWAKRVSQVMASGLKELGISGVGVRDGSDIALGDKKILGSCLYIGKDLMSYGASLLVNPDVSSFEEYLRHPPREPGYRQGRRHQAFVTTLWREGYTLSPGEVAGVIGPLLCEEMGLCKNGQGYFQS